jgi:aminoglycoside phosphotransferase (APT) family kinase protein
MHEGEVPIGADLVERLVADQFPALAQLPITEVRSTGTVNAVYRIGNALYARLPRMAHWAADLEREQHWLPWLAPRVSLDLPQPVAAGRPTAAYPFGWAIYRWLEGESYSDDGVSDEAQAARDLAGFVRELRRLDTAGAPPAGRRPLRTLDGDTRAAIEACRPVLDADAALAAWEDTLQISPWEGKAVWIHTDLLRPNILTRSGRISAVIDFGGAEPVTPRPTSSPPGPSSDRRGAASSAPSWTWTTRRGSERAASPCIRPR